MTEPNPPPTHTASDTLKTASARLNSLFSIPAPIKAVFDAVPVVVYGANDLPGVRPVKQQQQGRKNGEKEKAKLYVFCREEDVENGGPSFNPGCLRWQTFLKIAGIDHDLVSSNNHASPTGVLPFLLPALASAQTSSSASTEPTLPIPSNKLVKYALEQGRKVREPPTMRYEAYKSLLDTKIRCAWLHNLYLSPANLPISTRLYVAPTSSNHLVRASIAAQLQSAASAELLKSSGNGGVIDIKDIYAEAEKAFEALSILLGDGEWFFSGCEDDDGGKGKGVRKGGKGGQAGDEPTVFDAEVFAYTHLLLDWEMGWREKRLVRAVKKWENLVEHRDRVLRRYYEGDLVTVR